MTKDLWQVIHPKSETTVTDAEREVLDLVDRLGPMHPRDLDEHIGNERIRNYWGGFSRKGKMVLDNLHDRGALRVAGREKGIRIYETVGIERQALSKKERFKEIFLAALQSMGATTRKFLLRELSHFGYLVESPKGRRACLQELIDSGKIRSDLIDSVEYISNANAKTGRRNLTGVRILAPFDPIVRDRDRLEHFWNWTYRFEAYTPKSKRKMGYYAMPVLWNDEMIGWANASIEKGRLQVSFGYIDGAPKEPQYQNAKEAEIASMAQFLGLEI